MLRIGLLALVCAVALPSSAKAGVLYTGTGTGSNGVTLTASALFEISGNVLTITLTNTGDSTGATGTDLSANTLTGLFFDLPDGITLTPDSALIAPGDLFQADECSVKKGKTTTNPCSSSTTNVGGEFVYQTGTWDGHTGATSGISSSGYINADSGGGNFDGPNLDDPDAPDGINFGMIASTGTNAFNPNGGLADEPLIEGPVVFALTISCAQTPCQLLESQISNVSFQYGTSITEPSFGGGSEPQTPLPEPATLLLLAPALGFGIRRHLRARHTAAQ